MRSLVAGAVNYFVVQQKNMKVIVLYDHKNNKP